MRLALPRLATSIALITAVSLATPVAAVAGLPEEDPTIPPLVTSSPSVSPTEQPDFPETQLPDAAELDRAISEDLGTTRDQFEQQAQLAAQATAIQTELADEPQFQDVAIRDQRLVVTGSGDAVTQTAAESGATVDAPATRSTLTAIVADFVDIVGTDSLVLVGRGSVGPVLVHTQDADQARLEEFEARHPQVSLTTSADRATALASLTGGQAIRLGGAAHDRTSPSAPGSGWNPLPGRFPTARDARFCRSWPNRIPPARRNSGRPRWPMPTPPGTCGWRRPVISSTSPPPHPMRRNA